MELKKGFTMQVSIDINDDLYKEAMSSGLDMQSEFNAYLESVVDQANYLNSKEFLADKKDLHEALSELQNGTVQALSQEELNSAIQNFSK